MAYQSLYRKYRSRDFGDLVGQHHVTQTLANAIASGRVAHAYLFCGPRGTGKTSTARVLAKALNCVDGPTATPCDVCAYCQSIRQGSAMDVVEIDAASNRNIDDIRQLREQVNYPPVELRYKFYIVDEVHQLTRDSFNAFLKTLEEPPAHVIFVLCTTDPHQLPATILSRCQRFDFHRITQQDIVERMRWIVGQEEWTVEEEALQLVARTANGGMRDALSLLDQAAAFAGPHITAQHVREILGGIDLELLLDFSDRVIHRDANGLFALIERLMAEGKDVPQLVSELILHWRNLLRVTIGGAEVMVELAPEQRRRLAEQARATDQTAIMRAITLLCEAENELRWNSQQRLLVELYGLRIMHEEQAPAPVAAVVPSTRPAAPEPRPQPPTTTSPPPPTRRSEVRETPAPAKPTTAPPPADPLPVAPAGVDGAPTLARITTAWPAFISWLSKSSKLDTLRTRVVEKCLPTQLSGSLLTLTTNSGFVCEMVKERPQVKTTLEQCLQSYFKTPLAVVMAVKTEAAVEPAPVATPAAAPVNLADTLPPPPETPTGHEFATEEPLAPERDIIGERMREVFATSEEIAG